MSVTKTCRDITTLKPVAQKACNLFLEECKAAGLNVFITETYRSQERQNYLYAQGRTRDLHLPKVTWTRNSNHTGRLAWDIAVNPPQDLYDVATLKKAGAIAKRLGITWGGDWNPPDMPHFQVSESWRAPAVKPSAPAQASKPVDYAAAEVKYRLFTGTFASTLSAMAFKQKIERDHGVTMQLRVEGARVRLFTGIFVDKANMLAFKAKLERQYSIVLSVREEK